MLQGILFISGLVIASVTDIKSRTIPHSVCIFIALTSLINFSGVKLFGLLVAIPFFIGAGFGKGGAGDGFLVAASSLVLGLTVGLKGICLGLACFCLYYLVRKSIHKGPMPKSFPLAPFLSIGFIAAYLIGG